MPTDYVCEDCDLTFTVGWFHYHDFSSGYGAKTLLVCRGCGTMHAVEMATTDVQLPEGVERTVSHTELPPDHLQDRVLAQTEPMSSNLQEFEFLSARMSGLPVNRMWSSGLNGK